MCAESCATGLSVCGTGDSAYCAETQSDNQNCGACGKTCGTGQTCQGGTCVCDSPLSACGGACVDLETDSGHCGSCGTACAGGEVCSDGSCQPTCGSAYTTCGTGSAAYCADTKDDPKNCGGCGAGCGSGLFCVNGGCQTRCGGSEVSCGSACVDLESDEAHCGACGVSCIPGEECESGLCQCPAGEAVCGSAPGACVDLASDATHCGSCGHTCGSSQTCGGGVCVPNTPPHQIFPPSLSVLTGNQPMLRWALPPGVSTAVVEICADRPCGTIVQSFVVTGTSVEAAPLAPGLYFWRLHSLIAGSSMPAGPTWLFTASARSAPVTTAFGAVPDFNGDGYSDVAITSTAGVPGGKGLVYIFAGSATGLPSTPTIILPPSNANQFAISIGSAGDVNGDGYADLAVGGNTTVSGYNVATQFVYEGSPSGLLPAPTTQLYGIFFSAESAGDLNGDGYGDLAASQGYPRKVNIFNGASGGVPSNPTLSLTSSTPGFGESVANAGDVNGDGYEDLVVGNAGNFSNGNATDVADVYLGGAGSVPATPSFTFDLSTTYDTYYTVAGIGDVNGDGDPDWLLSGRSSDEATVYDSSSSPTTSWLTTDLTGGGGFAYSFAGLGDLNGDGYDDALIYDGWNNGPSVFEGSGTGLPAFPTATVVGGETLAGVGDVNGDGYADVIVDGPLPGEVSLYLGSSTGVWVTPAATLSVSGDSGFPSAIATE
jgi:hypothetical protein